MFTLLLAVSLVAGQSAAAVRHFQPADKSVVPKELIEAELCPDVEEKACWEVFEETGDVWVGDVNDDGVDELIVFPGTGYSGSGGDWYFLFQKQANEWVSLFLDRWGPLPRLEVDGWQTGDPRFAILPIIRYGYHDLRVTAVGCLKWIGNSYIFYDREDYRQLFPTWFDAKNLSEAEIFWLVRYAGSQQSVLEPQWFSGVPRGSASTELPDPEYDLEWWAMFKGGVYGVRGDKAFLLVPRPSHLGAKLGFEGDWLLIYEPEDPAGRPLARYNRRTGELILEEEE